MIFIRKNSSILYKHITIVYPNNVSLTKTKCLINHPFLVIKNGDTQENYIDYTCDYQQYREYNSYIQPSIPGKVCNKVVNTSINGNSKKVFFNNEKKYNNIKYCYTYCNSFYTCNLTPKVYRCTGVLVKKIKGVLGKIYISSTKNNTIITLIDGQGNTKGWSCSGSLGFKNARKSTTYAAQAAAENIIKKAKLLGYTHLRLLVKGLGKGKQSCLRALSKSGLKIISIEDKTGIPYNGCRLSKKRRV